MDPSSILQTVWSTVHSSPSAYPWSVHKLEWSACIVVMDTLIHFYRCWNSSESEFLWDIRRPDDCNGATTAASIPACPLPLSDDNWWGTFKVPLAKQSNNASGWSEHECYSWSNMLLFQLYIFVLCYKYSHSHVQCICSPHLFLQIGILNGVPIKFSFLHDYDVEQLTNPEAFYFTETAVGVAGQALARMGSSCYLQPLNGKLNDSCYFEVHT